MMTQVQNTSNIQKELSFEEQLGKYLKRFPCLPFTLYFAAMITEHIRVLVETRKCVQKADNEEFYLEPIVSQS